MGPVLPGLLGVEQYALMLADAGAACGAICNGARRGSMLDSSKSNYSDSEPVARTDSIEQGDVLRPELSRP
jgi:hypothetical protein